jgi:hypothetical protein
LSHHAQRSQQVDVEHQPQPQSRKDQAGRQRMVVARRRSMYRRVVSQERMPKPANDRPPKSTVRNIFSTHSKRDLDNDPHGHRIEVPS